MENSSTSSMNVMIKKSMGSDAITLSPYPGENSYIQTFVEVDDEDTAPVNQTTGSLLYPQGNGYIGRYKHYNPDKWLKSTSGGNGWVNSTYNAQIYDERFIVEIPVTLTPAVNLHDVLIKAGTPEVSEIYPETTDVNLFHTEYWLHIDSDNNYQLLKKDDTPFKGIMKRKYSTSSTIEEVTTVGEGDYFYFGGDKPYLKVDTTAHWDYKGEDMGADFANVITDNGTAPMYSGSFPYYSGTYFRVLPLYKANGEKEYAYKHNLTTGEDQGWYTNYFYGGDNIKKYFDSGWYSVGDLNAGQTATKYLYLMFNSISMPNHPALDDWRQGDNEYVVFDVPITVTSAEGVTSTMTVKVKVHDEE